MSVGNLPCQYSTAQTVRVLQYSLIPSLHSHSRMKTGVLSVGSVGRDYTSILAMQSLIQVEPLYCGHLGDLEKCPYIERCPHFRVNLY